MTPRRSGTTSTEARAQMVERQLRRRGISDERVLRAMGHVPREEFVPPGDRDRAYRDGAMRIGSGQTISQPWIVAAMAQALELSGRETVLEVGAGSGYSAAVLSLLAEEVITVERHVALADQASARLRDLGFVKVEVRVGDGTKGAPDRAPFDGIAVTATAEGDPPPALVRQLGPGAALVCPVRRRSGEHLIRYRDGEEEAMAPVRFVPLVSDEP